MDLDEIYIEQSRANKISPSGSPSITPFTLVGVDDLKQVSDRKILIMERKSKSKGA